MVIPLARVCLYIKELAENIEGLDRVSFSVMFIVLRPFCSFNQIKEKSRY